MIRFALKILIALLLVGYVMRLDEPVTESANAGGFIPTSYPAATDVPTDPDEVTAQLSALTNARIVMTHGAQDVTSFCERQPLACGAGRELIARAAAGIRDVAAAIVSGTEGEKSSVDAQSADDYRPLENYQGDYPLLPRTPPVRQDSF